MKIRNLTSVLPLMIAPAVVPNSGITENNEVSYIIGAVVALFILGYLIYSLLKPDKF